MWSPSQKSNDHNCTDHSKCPLRGFPKLHLVSAVSNLCVDSTTCFIFAVIKLALSHMRMKGHIKLAKGMERMGRDRVSNREHAFGGGKEPMTVICELCGKPKSGKLFSTDRV